MLDLDDVENMDKFVGDISHISCKLLTAWQKQKPKTGAGGVKFGTLGAR
jgi:hypothetical protein